MDQIESILKELEVVSDVADGKQWNRLVHGINELLINDFPRLVHLLYRMDVPEEKLKQALEKEGGDAAVIIARLLVARAAERKKAREGFTSGRADAGDEAW